MGTDRARRSPPGAARVTGLSLQAITAVGAVAGVQGFVAGAFDPLVDRLHAAVPLVQGPVLPALALGAVVALPQAAAFALGLRRHALAPDAALAVGGALTAWVTAQLPLIGLTSPVQWAFLAVGVVEVAAATAWRRHVPRRAPGDHRRTRLSV